MGSSFWKGLGILLVLPTLVLVALAGWVYSVNALGKGGPLSTAISPQAVLPGVCSTFFVTFDGTTDKATASPPKPIDVAFLVDVSSSMRESLPFMTEAASRATGEMRAAHGDRVHFSLIQFDTESRVLTGWTRDPEELLRGLQRLAPMADGTDPFNALGDLGKLKEQARGGGRVAAIFYTDGLFQCAQCALLRNSTDHIVKAAAQLRENGVEFYSVGLPGTDTPPVMLEITGDRGRVHQPADMAELARSFLEIAVSVSDIVGRGGVLTHQLDGRHFEAPIQGTDWQLDPRGRLRLELGSLPNVPSTFRHPIRPLAAGVWRVGVEPVSLYFLKDDLQVVELRATHRPAILVVTWWTLFFLLGPAALWTLVHLLPSRAEPEPELLPPPAVRPLPPARLPALPAALEAKLPVVPTLFLGLGELGRAALDEVRAELRQVHADSGPAPYLFRHFDLAEAPLPAQAGPKKPDDFDLVRVVAPRDVQRAGDYLPQPEFVRPHLAWFDARRYEHVSSEKLNLSEGSHGERLLARLALHEWVEKHGLGAQLADCLDSLLALPNPEGTRQVVLLASARGGWSSSALIDFARLVMRLARDRQRDRRSEFVPEVIAILCDDGRDLASANLAGLVHELTSSSLTGEFPRCVTLLPGDPLLDRVDSESPVHWVFRISSPDAPTLSAGCAQLVALLVERRSRTCILEEATRLLSLPSTTVPVLDATARALAIRPTILAELVECNLLLRLLGPDVLLDIVPKPSGGYGPRPFLEDELQEKLAVWMSEEPTGSPWGALLSTLRDPADAPRWLAALQASSFADENWIRNACLESLNRQLVGRLARDGQGWTRALMPSAAAAVLALLEARLAALDERLPRSAEGDRARAILGALRPMIAGCTRALADWLQAFCAECEAIGARRSRLEKALAPSGKSVPVRYLDPPDVLQAVDHWTQQVMRRWLSSQHAYSLLQERMFFVAESSPVGATVFVRSLLDQPVRLASASEVVALLGRVARSLVSFLPERNISGALDRLSEDQLLDLGRELVVRNQPGESAILALPLPAASFALKVPRPADQGDLVTVPSDDTTAVRRLQLSRYAPAEGPPPEFVDLSEQQAEKARAAIEQSIGLQVPLLPPRLRIALSQSTAFRAFARAYWCGRIVRRSDPCGALHWFYLDREVFLTFGRQTSLAAAAANFAWHVDQPLETEVSATPKADFDALDQWRKTGGLPDEEALAQAAIQAAVNGSI